MTHPGTTEHQEQTMVFLWANAVMYQYPELRWLHAIPNERFSKNQRIHFAREGVRAGVADMFLPVPRGEYHGLYIEMKKPGGRVRPIQIEFLDFVREQGYRAEVCYGADAAIKLLEEYILC